MEFQNFGPASKTQQSAASSITFANTGSGVGVFRTVNGPIVEMNTISGHHLEVGMLADDRTISIDATGLYDMISRQSEKLFEMSSKLADLKEAYKAIPQIIEHSEVKLRSRIGQLEARPGFTLPESLYDLAQMPRFHGSVPVIQNGKWAAINLSNDFFNKYEQKMDACIAVTGDVRRKVSDQIIQQNDAVLKYMGTLESDITRWKWATFTLAIMILVLTVRVILL